MWKMFDKPYPDENDRIPKVERFLRSLKVGDPITYIYGDGTAVPSKVTVVGKDSLLVKSVSQWRQGGNAKADYLTFTIPLTTHNTTNIKVPDSFK